MKKKVLITGITGFVGSHLADYILSLNDRDIEVHGTRRWRSPVENIEHIIEKIQLHYCELLDAKSVQDLIAAVKPDIIFHLAAQSYVMTSFSAPVNTIETNVCGTVSLLEAVRYAKIDPVIHICSSSEVYGQVRENEVPIKESQPFRPASPYAVSKVGEDMLASQYGLSYGLRIICTRMFTHTGPRRGEV
ncbi:MAG: GDP-mannose 4,6-dehydratase, partial [Candidatus Omnitrophica bacterium]|nr:GDP-mannose 4,6-dehydratase [Candidatus Omnitrophota bacterium]